MTETLGKIKNTVTLKITGFLGNMRNEDAQ
jgi:hypothetical protein